MEREQPGTVPRGNGWPPDARGGLFMGRIASLCGVVTGILYLSFQRMWLLFPNARMMQGARVCFAPSVFPFILKPSVNGRTKFCAGTDGPSWAGY